MSGENDNERSLPATPKRLEQAREEGQVARSRELVSSLVLITAAAACWWLGPQFARDLGGVMRAGLAFDHGGVFDSGSMLTRLGDASRQALYTVLPWLAMLVVAACAGGVALGGWIFSTKSLAPDFSRMSPGRGLGNMLSGQAAGELGKAIAKVLLVGVIAGVVLWSDRDALVALAGSAPRAGIAHAGTIMVRDFVLISAATLLIAAVDVPFQLWRYHSKLRMSLEEVKREMRESEGDPQLKARVRSIQRERARKRMMSEVPKADVVVTNPSHYAVALAYKPGQRAPRVLAKGRDIVAAKIREVAGRAGVPLLEAPPLARALYRHSEIGADIPWQLYEAVALVLAWVMQLRALKPGKPTPRTPSDLPIPADWGAVDQTSEAGAE
ncbi:MAG TPA: flagellar biosynthesis protein FlhB [Burkholderiales bacterium]|nr:flagellar biosynthesis protein FlhB [Burkholderiales bacterium]